MGFFPRRRSWPTVLVSVYSGRTPTAKVSQAYDIKTGEGPKWATGEG